MIGIIGTRNKDVKGGAKPRRPPKKIKVAEDNALREAARLEEEYSKFHGKKVESCLSSDFVPGRTLMVDSGASFNVVGRNFLTAEERGVSARVPRLQ